MKNKAEEIIKRHRKYGQCSYFYAHEIIPMMQEYSDLCNKQDGWISAKTELPEEDEDVLVCTKKGVMCKTHNIRLSDKQWFGYGEAFCTYDVTHWQPLPKKPQQ